MGAPLAGDTGNLFGPVPLASLGLIVMQPIAIFQPSYPQGNLGVTADGNYLRYVNMAGQQVFLSQNGQTTILPDQSNLSAIPPSKICPEWIIGGGRFQSARVVAAPKGFISGTGGGVTDGLLQFKLYDAAQNIVAQNYSIPSVMAESGTPTPYYEYKMWQGFNPFNGQGGSTPFGTGCWKQDDFGGAGNGLYSCNQYFPVTSPQYTFNTMRFPSDLSKTPEPSFNVNTLSYVFSGENSYRAGLQQIQATNTSEQFQNLQGAYAANFTSQVGWPGSYFNGTCGNSGFNCVPFNYWDIALDRILPARLAQDQYLFANMQTQGNTQNAGSRTLMWHCTRFVNSATYAQTIYQPGYALNETMDQYGVSTEYPECQLPTVGIFGSDGQVNYSNVIPQNFEKLDLVLQPDLLWVSPNGQVLGVYHAPGSENYYFMIGGTRATYQSSVYNYRYGVS
jgi:hypothetical protein